MSRSGRGHVGGSLAAYGEDFRQALLDRGYTWESAAHQVHLMAHLSRWLDANAADAAALTPAVAERFLQARRAEGYTRMFSARALSALLEFLDSVGVVASGEAAPDSEEERLIGRYEQYLRQERSLAPDSVRSYLRTARRFLADVTLDRAGVSGVDAAMVTGFVRRECRGTSFASAKVTVTGLRSLLRFLYLDGTTGTLLTDAVPSPAGWQLAPLPRAISTTELAGLLASCDPSRPLGRRDFAILTMLSRLGLRASEVGALELGDIDWRAGAITVRGKGGREDRLPLPVDVGEAIADWLRFGRPPGLRCPAVFTRHRAPHGPLTGTGVSAVVRRAGRRAGVGPLGAHRLRHTTAVGLVAAGASLAEVGQVLRHTRVGTTAIYAKVDVRALAAVAQPWPEQRP